MKLKSFLQSVKINLAIIVSSFCSRKHKDVWLVGENLGKSNGDNGFYFFEYLIKNTEKEVYFLVDKNRKLPEDLIGYSSNIISINSFKHFFYYFLCQYCIVSHGIRDAVPEVIALRKKQLIKPIVYLQHGVIKYKKIPYSKLSYNKSIIRFIASSEDEKNIIVNEMMSKRLEREISFVYWKLMSNNIVEKLVEGEGVEDTKLLRASEYVGKSNYKSGLEKKLLELEKKVGIDPSRVLVTGLPRYDSLLKMQESTQVKKKILIFPTWREYLVKENVADFENSDFYTHYLNLVTDQGFIELLRKTGYEVKFFMHVEMHKFYESFKKFESRYVKISDPTDTVRHDVLESSILITDYSSLSWEFLLLGKPTIFYHFDFEEYLVARGTYAGTEGDWNGIVAKSHSDLLTALWATVTSSNCSQAEELSELGFQANPGACARVLEEIENIPPKIYFAVYNIFGFGGTVKTVINTANYLYSKGYDVEIISIRKTHHTPKLGLNPGVKVRPLYDARRNAYKKNRGSFGRLKNTLVRLLRKLPSLLINKHEELYSMLTLYTDIQLLRHFRSIKEGVLVTTIPSLNRLSAKVVSNDVYKIGQEHRTYHDHHPDLVRSIFSHYKKLDLLTVLTEDDKDNYNRNLPAANVVVQGNGTEVSKSKPKESHDQKKIVSLGRLVDYKGYDLLIDAFAKIVHRFPDWTLDIYGRGVERDVLNKKITELTLENHVRILEPVSDIDPVLLDASIFALPSRIEPFGMVILEAGACALPIVAFDIEYGPKSLLHDGYNGLLARKFDVDDYSEKLSLLMENDSLREKLGNAAYANVLKNHSIEAVGQKFEKLLSGVDS